MWLGLGTNLGDRARNLARALDALERVITIDAASDVFETEPFGYTAQPRFWNMVVRGRTDLAPHALLARLQQSERELGRTRTFRMGPRSIDIDILLYDAVTMDVPGLVIPHPGLRERAFVLLPLLDIDPDVTHPVTHRPLAADAAVLDATGVRRVGSAAALLHREGKG